MLWRGWLSCSRALCGQGMRLIGGVEQLKRANWWTYKAETPITSRDYRSSLYGYYKMESSSAIDLRALPTTTPAASIRDSVGERPRSPQLENNLESGIEQADVERVSGSGFDISNVANQHHSHLPAEDDAPLEEYLQNLAYSNDEARRLLYNYKTFRQQPGISLFSESTGVFYKETENFGTAMTDRNLGTGSRLENWLEELRRLVRSPPSGGLRIWSVCPSQRFLSIGLICLA